MSSYISNFIASDNNSQLLLMETR